MKEYKILVKFPTRSRPQKCLEVIKKYVEYSADPERVFYLITTDTDDISMQTVRKQIEALHHNITIIGGYSTNKIHACNRGISEYKKPWDIVVLASDDMICETRGWDKIIRERMRENFPDTDGCLWFWDGDQATLKGQLCTMSIMGRLYTEILSFDIYDLEQLVLYHPSYLSLWCDNEHSEIARKRNKMKFFDHVLFRHIHPSNSNMQPDPLMKKTQSYFQLDQANYNRRKLINFELK